MQIEDWPDDPYFNPRLHWAEENSEYVSSLVLLERKRYDEYIAILNYIEKGPTTVIEMANHFKLKPDRVRALLQCLRGRGVIFTSDRDKITRNIAYTIKSRPAKMPFILPERFAKFKLSIK